jgi:hypothetical protein
MTDAKRAGTVLAFAIHGADLWWREVGREIGFDRFVIMSAFHDDGDYNLRGRFYDSYRKVPRSEIDDALETGEMREIIARCRTLRWMPPLKAARMALAIRSVMEEALDAISPSAIASWPIDNFITDTLARCAELRAIPYIELTASPLLDRTMMLYRGRMIESQHAPDPELVEAARHELADPLFMLPQLRRKRRYTAARFWKIFLYFKIRGLVFWLLSYLWRDPLNVHYLDAQAFLGHKPRLGDYRMLGRQNPNWKVIVERVPREKRVFMALQLFPEASIDYWISDLSLVTDHEGVLVEVARAFSEAGYTVAVKDHPLQFGFRQVALIDKLLTIRNVAIVPYEVSGNDVVACTGVTFTTTGTLGMQTAMMGSKTIAADPYFTTPKDFILLSNRDQVEALPSRVEAFEPSQDLEARQRRIAEKLLRGSFPGDYMTYSPFRRDSDPAPVRVLGRNLGVAIDEVLRGIREVAALPS